MNTTFSYTEIDELAEGLIRQYLGQRQKIPQSVDIESFAKKYLKLPVMYCSFANAETGKIGFISDGRTPLSITENGKQIKKGFPKGTIVIEKYLCQDKEAGRRRFTISHECGHYILDKALTQAGYHREYDSEQTYTVEELKPLFTFREAQIDRLGAALLMPRSLMEDTLRRYTKRDKVTVYGDNLLKLEDKGNISKMAAAMNVSYTAFFIRLKELNMLEHKPLGEYIVNEMGFTR